MTYQPGDTLLNKYRIKALIGRGAFAEVYRATHLALNAPRALKILHKDAPGLGSTEYGDFQARFQLEAQLGARLSDHPNIIQVHDFEQDGETLILMMEYASGGSLSERLAKLRQREQILPIDEVVQIALDVAQGLAAIHTLDAVHRDLKPSNILFDRNGRAKVADVGLAQIPGGPSMRSQLSMAAPHPGTPGYMSPEQESLSNYLTPASDVFALGLALFEMLTGRVYRSQRPGTRATDLRDEVPAWLDDLLARMLEKEVPARPWNGAETAGLLEEGIKQENEKRKTEQSRREVAATAQHQAEEQTRLEAERRRAEQQRLEKEARAKADADRRQREKPNVRLPKSPAWWARLPRWAWGALGGLVVVGVILMIILGNGNQPVTPTLSALANTTAPAVQASPTITATRTLLPTLTPTLPNTATPSPTTNFGAPMVLIPAGSFDMGSDAAEGLAECQKLYEPFTENTCDRDWFTDEEPIHTVTLEEYYMDQYEVTNAAYEKCVDAGVCDPAGGSYYTDSEYADHPVVNVSWSDAETYCAWRGARLPTEAEWEKAARGGIDGLNYPWGDEFATGQANFCDSNCSYDWKNTDIDDGYAQTSPVGEYEPNGYGVYDMAGNIWEWVEDWYDSGYYAVSPTENPTGPESGDYRVLRGGSWSHNGYYLRVANRANVVPSLRNFIIGFRCARSVSP